MSEQVASAALAEAGVDPARVRVIEPGENLAGLEAGVWVLLEGASGSWIVGGTERGELTVYDQYESIELAVGALHHVTSTSVPARRLTPTETATLARNAADLTRRLMAETAPGDWPRPVTLPAGMAVDRFGGETGSATFAFRTPLPMRALAPTEATARYHAYAVLQPLGGGVLAGPVAPWFGQPGGGLKVQLPRCVRWYCDAGFLEAVEPATAEHG